MLQGILKPAIVEGISYEVHHHGPISIPQAGLRFVVDQKAADMPLGPEEERHHVTCYFDKKKREAGIFEPPADDPRLPGVGRAAPDSQIKGVVVIKKDHVVLDRVAYEDIKQHFGRRINCEPIGGAPLAHEQDEELSALREENAALKAKLAKPEAKK